MGRYRISKGLLTTALLPVVLMAGGCYTSGAITTTSYHYHEPPHAHYDSPDYHHFDGYHFYDGHPHGDLAYGHHGHHW